MENNLSIKELKDLREWTFNKKESCSNSCSGMSKDYWKWNEVLKELDAIINSQYESTIEKLLNGK